MKNIVTAIILLMIFLTGFSQTTYDNLQKYWFYRERLKKFVLVSSNYSEEGTNIPAERIYGNNLEWDEGNASFNQYISVLATEYRLLKNYHQNYSQTIKELYYALKSFERLDDNAESYYRKGREKYISDLNGFFNRKDITPAFWEKYNKNGSNPYFEQINTTEQELLTPENASIGNFENSEDNCWHFLEAFSLVNALVDKEYVDGIEIDFKQIVKDNVKRIVDNMVHDHLIHTIAWKINPPSYIKDDLAFKWYVNNPVTNSEVRLGSGTDGTMYYASYGFAQAAKNIIGINQFNAPSYSSFLFKNLLSCPITAINYNVNVYNRIIPIVLTGYIDVELALDGPNYNLVIFDFVSDPPLFTTIDSWSKTLKEDIDQDDYKLRSLCTTGNISDANGVSPYNVLIRKQTENQTLKYEHLPLIWSVINNDNTKISEIDRLVISNLLKDAPVCGPNKTLIDGVLYYRNINWSSQSRLVWPNRNGENSFLADEYNGLDYMLLHNLYWLTNLNNYLENIDYDPNQSTKSTLIATNIITCSKVISGNLSVNLIAGNSVKLFPGFSSKPFNSNNVRITTYIPNSPNAFIFKKVSLSGYPVCNSNLKSSQSIINESDLIDMYLSIYPNPCADILNITIENNVIDAIEIFNSTNLLMTQLKCNSCRHLEIDLSTFPAGIYFVRIYTNKNTAVTRKIIRL